MKESAPFKQRTSRANQRWIQKQKQWQQLDNNKMTMCEHVQFDVKIKTIDR